MREGREGADWRRRREGVTESSDPPLEPNTLAVCADVDTLEQRKATPLYSAAEHGVRYDS